MSSINALTSNYVQQVLNTALKSFSPATAGSSGISSLAQPPDNRQISPFAQALSALQQLQQSDPAKYQQVTQLIATNLDGAAQAAQKNGNITAANQLTQLSTDFTNASKSGQLPNIQDLAQSIGGGHQHHRHHAPEASTNSGSDPNSNSASQTLSQFLSNLQAGGSQTDAQGPLAIILATLSKA